MTLQSDQELANTREKLRLLEQSYEEVLQEVTDDKELRDAELQSLKRFINQLKEEIAWYEAHQPARLMNLIQVSRDLAEWTAITSIRRRWRPRFGLRTLLVAITLVCVLLGAGMFWYRAQKIEHDRQWDIVQKLKFSGAEVFWRSRAPDWIIESEHFRVSPSINQMEFFKIFEFVETVRCRPNADVERVIDLLDELPKASDLSINISSFNENVLARLAKLPQLREVVIDYYRHEKMIDDPNFLQQASELRAKLPGVKIQQATSVNWTPDDQASADQSSSSPN